MVQNPSVTLVRKHLTRRASLQPEKLVILLGLLGAADDRAGEENAALLEADVLIRRMNDLNRPDDLRAGVNEQAALLRCLALDRPLRSLAALDAAAGEESRGRRSHDGESRAIVLHEHVRARPDDVRTTVDALPEY